MKAISAKIPVILIIIMIAAFDAPFLVSTPNPTPHTPDGRLRKLTPETIDFAIPACASYCPSSSSSERISNGRRKRAMGPICGFPQRML